MKMLNIQAQNTITKLTLVYKCAMYLRYMDSNKIQQGKHAFPFESVAENCF